MQEIRRGDKRQHNRKELKQMRRHRKERSRGVHLKETLLCVLSRRHLRNVLLFVVDSFLSGCVLVLLNSTQPHSWLEEDEGWIDQKVPRSPVGITRERKSERVDCNSEEPEHTIEGKLIRFGSTRSLCSIFFPLEVPLDVHSIWKRCWPSTQSLPPLQPSLSSLTLWCMPLCSVLCLVCTTIVDGPTITLTSLFVYLLMRIEKMFNLYLPLFRLTLSSLRCPRRCRWWLHVGYNIHTLGVPIVCVSAYLVLHLIFLWHGLSQLLWDVVMLACIKWWCSTCYKNHLMTVLLDGERVKCTNWFLLPPSPRCM